MNSVFAKFLKLICFKLLILWKSKYVGHVVETYNINMAQDDTEPEIPLQFPYPVIQVIWM
jgi:hypothetical protein